MSRGGTAVLQTIFGGAVEGGLGFVGGGGGEGGMDWWVEGFLGGGGV